MTMHQREVVRFISAYATVPASQSHTCRRKPSGGHQREPGSRDPAGEEKRLYLINIQYAIEISGPQLILKDLCSMGNLGPGWQDRGSEELKMAKTVYYRL